MRTVMEKAFLNGLIKRLSLENQAIIARKYNLDISSDKAFLNSLDNYPDSLNTLVDELLDELLKEK